MRKFVVNTTKSAAARTKNGATMHPSRHSIFDRPLKRAPTNQVAVGALGGFDFLHGESHPTLTIDLEDLDLYQVAFGKLVADLLDALVRNL